MNFHRLYFLTIIIPVFMFLMPAQIAQARKQGLKSRLDSILNEYHAKAGISIKYLETGDTLSIHGNDRFPMQSVYKFHLALAAYNQLEKRQLSVDDSILVKPEDLLPNTWSPIRDKYPSGNIYLSFREIIRFTVSESDNNGCDILFRWLGGPAEVGKFIQMKGYDDISIAATEEEMHKDWDTQFTNTCTPNSAVALLEGFYSKKIIPSPYQEILWNQMVESTTGAGRLRKLLPERTIIAHKTGSSGKNRKGISAATNDIGIICLPDGSHLIIAVFITESAESSERNDELIARIAYESYKYFLSH